MAAEPHSADAADDSQSQASSVVPSTNLASTEDAAGGSACSEPDSWIEESCRRELAAAEALLPPTVVLPKEAVAPSEPQLVEPSPRGPPAAAATWRYLSDLRPAKLGMRAALPSSKAYNRRAQDSASCRCPRGERGLSEIGAVRMGTALRGYCSLAQLEKMAIPCRDPQVCHRRARGHPRAAPRRQRSAGSRRSGRR